MPGGLFLVRIYIYFFFPKVHDVFICEHTFDYVYKNMNGKPDEGCARGRYPERDIDRRKNRRWLISPVRINASVAMGRESE